MLAQQHGLALITEKLQNQRLEEPAAGSSGAVPVVTASTTISGKLPEVGQDTYLISESSSGRGHSSSGLSVKGKNLWTTPQADSDHHRENVQQKVSGIVAASYPISSPRNILPPLCHHKKQRLLCQICDIGPGTPSAPPKKKHCRSLSVPPDGPSTPTFFPSGKDSSTSPGARFSIGIGGSQSQWLSNYNHHHHCPQSCHSSHHHHSHSHHHASKIWRPIAVVPLRSAGLSSSNSSSSSKNDKSVYNSVNANKIRERTTSSSNQRNFISNADIVNNDNDQFNNHSSNIGNNNYLWSTSVSGFDEKNNNLLDATVTSNNYNKGVNQSTSGFHYHHNKYKLMPPSSSSSVSFDSGHFTTSDFQSPPSSPPPPPPIPDQRPASAASDTSFSSLGWFDFSPMPSRLNILQNRSLSCEDRISACSSCCSSASSPIGATSNNTTSMPCVYQSNNSNKLGEEIMDTARDSSVGSAVCCPHAGVSNSAGIELRGGDMIPRCHSQPCVLHHRRCGKKRRRDCDRPTLNFNKMTETAYISSPGMHRKSEPWNCLPFDAQIRPWKSQGHSSFSKSNPIQNPFVLNPIASSPLDSTSEFLMSKHLSQSIPHSGGNSTIEQSSQEIKPIRHVIPLGHIDNNENDEEDKEEISNDEECDDDGEEEEDDVEEGGNCSCHDPQRKTDSITVFPTSDFDDLDLEQIETH